MILSEVILILDCTAIAWDLGLSLPWSLIRGPSIYYVRTEGEGLD